MNRRSITKPIAGAALTALVGAGLVTTASPATAAYESADVVAGMYYSKNYDDAACVAASSAGDRSKPISDNNVAVTHSNSGTVTVTKAADKSTMAFSSSATFRSTPIGGRAPTSITGSARASATASANLGASSACNASITASGGFDGDVTLPVPMWATISLNVNGSGADVSGGLDIWSDETSLYFDVPVRSSGSITTLLAAGETRISPYVSARATAEGATPGERAASVSASYTIRLTPQGHPSAPKGKSKGTVVLGARDCSTGSIAAALTKKAKKRAASIVVKVNGKKRAKFASRKKLRKRAFSVPASRTAPAKVVAKIKLKSGKKLTVSRSYLAC